MAAVSTDIHNLVKILGRRPTPEDYVKEGKYPIDLVYKLFKSKEWDEILSNLGYKIRQVSYTNQQVVSELERIAKQLGKFPPLEEYNQLAKIPAETVKLVVKASTWIEALSTVFNVPANLIDQAINPNHSYYQEQINKLKSIAIRLRRTPTRQEASKYGVNIDLLIKRLNKTWIELLPLAEIDATPGTINSNSNNRTILKEEMLEDLNLIAKELGYYPGELKYDLLGCYSSSNLKYRFDKGWSGIIDLAKAHISLLAKVV